MQEPEFYQIVQRRGRVDGVDEARAATEATLRTLGERIAEGEAENVADQLPSELGAVIADASDGDAADFGIEAFFDRVADRASEHDVLDEDRAELHAQAVTDALSQAVSGGQLEDVRDQLPREYDALFETVDVDEEPV